MTLQLKTKKQVEETVEIEVPAFFKSGGAEYIGIFDVDNVIKFYKGFNGYGSAQFDNTCDGLTLDGYERIDEQEFRIEHMKHMEKFNLPHRQITTAELNEAI